MKSCIECGKIAVERNRCKECVLIYNRLRAKKYYKKDKPRYGIIKCRICGKNLIKKSISQLDHGACKIKYKTTENYNLIKRSPRGNTIARQMVLDLGFNLKGFCIHHLDENPNNNTLTNFWILSRALHSSLHQFYQHHRSLLGKPTSSNLENCWNTFRDQLTTTWLETTGVNVIKITDIRQSAAEPLTLDNIYIFSTNGEGSETMYQVPETYAVGKEIVQTQNEESCSGN